MTQVDLKPCPFCGGSAEMRKSGNEYTRSRATKVLCSKCRFEKTVKAFRNSLAWTESHAIAAWNTRTITTAEAAKVLLDHWDEHGEGPLGDLVPYSQSADGELSPDIDGDWVRFSDVCSALRAAVSANSNDNR